MRWWRLLPVAVLAALSLAGCMRFSADLTLSPDDTVSGEFIVAVKKGSGDAYGMTDRELAEAIWEDYPRAAALGDTHRSPYDADGYRGVTVHFADAPLTAFAPTTQDWGVVRDGDSFVITGPAHSSADALAQQGADGAVPEGGAFTGDTSGLDDAQLSLSITFPGAIDHANGDVHGRTVTWDLQHGPATLDAQGSAVKSSDPAVVVAYVVFAALVVGGVGYALAGRMKDPQH